MGRWRMKAARAPEQGRLGARRTHSVAILPHMCPSPVTAVGRSVPRREGADKVLGRARYTDELIVPGAWYGKTIRSTIACGRIRAVTFDPAFDWSRVVVVTAADIPGDNVVSLIRDDQPILVPIGGEIQHQAEALCLLAAADRATLIEARRHVHPRTDLLPSVFDPLESTREFAHYEVKRGDLEIGFAEAEIVIEGT